MSQGDCSGEISGICQAWQAGYDEGFVAGQREGASVALRTDTVYVWRREPIPANDVVGWALLWIVVGMLVGRFFEWATGGPSDGLR